MSVEDVPMQDLHQELARLAPGSPEEQDVLQKARERRDHKTDEFRVVRNDAMNDTAEHGVIRGHEAQHAAQIAITQVTGEHAIPVEIIEHPGTMH
jgi:hypothetical protein